MSGKGAHAVLGLLAVAIGCSSAPSSGDCNYLGVVPIDLGQVVVGQGSNAGTLQIENLGRAPIDVTSVELADGGVDDGFSLDAFEAQLLQPGDVTPVTVHFQPGAIGAASAEVVIAGDGCTRSVTVTGTGLAPLEGVDAGAPAPCVTVQSALDFGSVVVGSSLTLPLLVQSCQGQPVNVVPQAPNPAFSMAGPPLVLPGQSFTYAVTYVPSTAAGDDMQIAIDPCINCSSPSVALSGAGLQGTLDCETGGDLVTCPNVGNWPLVILSVSAPGFVLAGLPTLPVQVAPGQSFSFEFASGAFDGGGAGLAEAFAYPPGLPDAGSWVVLVPF